MRTKTHRTSKNLEIEVKLKVSNLQKLRARIRRLGFRELEHRKFEDNWVLDFPEKPLLKKDCLLRLRQFGGKYLLTFKAPPSKSAPFKTREELETGIADGATFREILKRLGLVLSFRYQKYRSLFACKESTRSKNVVLGLDETPVGNYLEIEGAPDMIRVVADQLGYSREDYITQSYYEIYARNKPRSQNREMTFVK
jgi:adenylate cyclase, class 2